MPVFMSISSMAWSKFVIGLLIIVHVNAEIYDYYEHLDRTQMSASHGSLKEEKEYYEQLLLKLENSAPATSKADTIQFLQRVQSTCRNLKRLNYPPPAGHCPYFYDSFSCWRPTPIGSNSTKTCPKYILGMRPGVTIQIKCAEVEGNSSQPYWEYLALNESHFMALYGDCFESFTTPSTKSPLNPLHFKLQEILRKTQMVGPVCYSISLVALAVASLTFLCFKRLHCPRNFIHLHLFLAFMIRAIMCLLQYYLFGNGQSMASDGEMVDENGVTKFLNPGPHWECKLLVTIWNYSLVASFFWLLVEGLYLHNVVYFFVFRETGISGYAIFGWVAPMLVIVPWIAVKVLVEDNLCWLAYSNLNYFWILRGPIMATIIINFLLFINMIRELFLKLKDSHITETRRYMKLAKSSVLLVVILGVYYFIISIPMLLLDTVELTWPLLICLSVEHIFGSLQGLMVALVYCFMNSEVRGVVKKRWYRWILLRQVSSQTYSSTGTDYRSTARQGSGPQTLMSSLLPQLSQDDEQEKFSSRLRRSILFRGKTQSKKPVKRVKSVTPVIGSPRVPQKCLIGGDLCVNCNIADSLINENGVFKLCHRLNNTPCSGSPDLKSALKMNLNGDLEKSSLSPSVRSQNPLSNTVHSGKLNYYQKKIIDEGDTIALLRMRSPHSFDMQELNKTNNRRMSRDEADLVLPPTWLSKANGNGKHAFRRYSLNTATSVVSYLPITNITHKTTTAMTKPFVKAFKKQSNDAFL